MPKLEEVIYLYAGGANYVNLPSLIKAHDISLRTAIEINIPILKEVLDMSIPAYEGDIDFPELEKCETINVNSAKTVNLPKLKEFQKISCKKASIIKIPNIEFTSYTEKIYVDSADKIIVPRFFLRGCLRNVKHGCKIVYADEEETTNESFKAFFKR
jgi:hypothetical protein